MKGSKSKKISPMSYYPVESEGTKSKKSKRKKAKSPTIQDENIFYKSKKSKRKKKKSKKGGYY